MDTALFHSRFRCKSWADEELYAMVATLDAAAHPEKRDAAIRILNPIHGVDRIFRGNLSGQLHGCAITNTPDTPELAQLLETVRDTDAWYLDHVAALTADKLSEIIHFTFTDGGHGRMSRAEMQLQVITRGGYHRGAVGRTLADCGIQPPRDIYTLYLHDSEPARRQPS